MSHTKEPWIVASHNECVGVAKPTDDGNYWVGDMIPNQPNGATEEANARRIVACVNACEGIPTEKIEGRNIADYVTSEAFLTGMEVHGGLNVGLKGLAVQMLAEQFAGQFVGNGVVNFLDLTMVSEETGPLIVTIQRKHGKTPAQLKAEIEQQRDELLAALQSLGVIGSWYCFCSHDRDPDKTEHEPECHDARAAIAKAGATNA